jgi:glycosyltransferase involved in cell wall biosynthesis
MKGHSTFIEAAALLIKKGNNIRIVCVGEGLSAYGDDGEELRSLASQLGLGKRIIWAGSRRDMPAVYNAFDVAVSSSRWGEGFPNVIVEAMACGIPCVATDVGDSASIIGETGQPIIPDDPEALAIGIESAMKGRDNEKRAILRQRIVQNFTLQMMVRTTETLLSDLIRDIPVVLSRVDQAL